MKRFRSRITTAFFVLLLPAVIYTGCQRGEDQSLNAEDAFKAAYDKYRVSDDREAKAALMDGFVASHPDSEPAGRAIGMVVYNRYSLNDDPEGALAYLDGKLELISNPGVRKAVELQKLTALAELGDSSSFSALVATLLESDPGLTPEEERQVLGAASTLGAWDLSIKISDVLLEKVSGSEDPYGRSEILMEKAWALHNLDHDEEALGFYREAASLAPRNFAGYYEYPTMELEYQWAATLRSAGRVSEALDLFSPRAVLVREEEKRLQESHQALLKELYLANGGEEASFDSFKAGKREEISRAVPDFSAPDANGTTRSFKEIKGAKATLLVFWFPT